MQFEYKNQCFNNCELLYDNEKIICDAAIKFLTTNIIYYLDEVIKTIQDSLKTGYNTTSIDNGDDEIIKIAKIIYMVTNTKNQKIQINDNVTTIDLGKCED